ncbi:MAG TPA: aminotransferase class V-fold PLP-dependent enzyme [Opitutaceae bacterium]|nr:aminotransferase class V-fold PLP-dependent enzyme [Opitutaceae bacterium]
MMLDRRDFMQGLGLGALGALAGCASASGGAPRSRPAAALPAFESARPEDFWRAVRAQYPLLDDPVYLNTGGLGPTPQPVLDTFFATMLALQEHSETGHVRFEPVRAIVASFVGAEASEICLVRNATEGNSIVAAGLALREGDEVIFESHAHPGGSFPWFNQERLRGVKVRIFEPDATSAEGNLKRIAALVTPRTRVIQVSHLTCTAGVVMPVDAIAAFARSRGIWFHIDGAQSVGMIPVNFHAIGCDSYAFSGHKWLGAPHETGVLYLKKERVEEVAPTGIGAHAAELNWLPGDLKYATGAMRHEYGTRNAGAVEALAEAVRFQERLGRERIASRGHALSSMVMTELAGVRDLSLLTPRDPASRGSMVAVQHARASASVLFDFLYKKHRLRCRPVTEQGLQAVRISTHVFTSPADCERVVAALKASTREL